MSTELQDILRHCVDIGASDLLLTVNSTPRVYVNGCMHSLASPLLDTAHVTALLDECLDEELLVRLNDDGDVDFALQVAGVPRCRVNVHRQRNTLAAAFRLLPASIPTIEALNLPEIIYELTQLPHGLVLVTGAAAQGKSTTLAAMIEHINASAAKHIITLEDPIECLFENNRALIEQREIGHDSPSFSSAMRHILRQKPDVIFVGELRDPETMAAAVTAAETGHLVLSTLHTMSASQAVERIVDMFEGAQQQQIRIQLAQTLQAVVSQALLPAIGGGLLPACEILLARPGIRRAIRDNHTHLLPGMIETGAKHGMQTMDQAVSGWVAQNKVSKEDAWVRLEHLTELKVLCTLPQKAEPTANPISKPV